jgi:hypothetical protein
LDALRHRAGGGNGGNSEGGNGHSEERK